MASSLSLPYVAPWRWAQFHQYFALRLLPGVESLTPDRYSRSVRLAQRCGWISVTPAQDADCLELTISDSLADQAQALAQRVTNMFDLATDPAVLAAHFAGDTELGPRVALEPGLRLPSAFDPFELAVRAIIGQQVSVKAAVTIARRLIERLGKTLPDAAPDGLCRLFPTPQAVAQGNLEKIGMPTRRVATLQRLAAAVADGALALHTDQGADDLVARLCKLPGIGPWTAQYIALRGFGEADAFPAADLGLMKAPLWGPGGLSAKALLGRAEAWRPWRAYAAMHIWQDYARGQAPISRGPAAQCAPAPGPDQ